MDNICFHVLEKSFMQNAFSYVHFLWKYPLLGFYTNICSETNKSFDKYFSVDFIELKHKLTPMVLSQGKRWKTF